MRRLAIAQLGTNDLSFDQKKFVEVLVDQTIRKIVPHALRSASKVIKEKKHKAALEEASVRCEREGNLEAAKNAREAADAAYAYTNASADVYAAYAATATAYTATATATAASANAYAAYTATATATAYAASANAYAAYTATATATAYAAVYAAYAATAVDAYADADADAVLNMSADIGVQALRAAGAHGIELMDQLILVSDATRAAIDSAMENKS
jgi:hypothetical protein